MTNVEFLKWLTNKSPQFLSHVAEGTRTLFETQGVMPLKNNPEVANAFWTAITNTWSTQFIMPPRMRNNLEAGDFGEAFESVYGAAIRRMYMRHLLPLTPQYDKLVEGQSIDQQVVRKGSLEEAFWTYNYAYANRVTIPDDWNTVQITDNGEELSQIVSGLYAALDAAYYTDDYLVTLEAIGKGLLDTEAPLQDTQKIDVTGVMTASTNDEKIEAARNVVVAILQAVEAMTNAGAYSSAFNQAEYENVQDRDRLRVLVKPGIATMIQTAMMISPRAFDRLEIPLKTITVPHFGGLIPYAEAALTTRLYPVYRSGGNAGEVIGFANTQGASTPTVSSRDVFWKDPTANIPFIVADKGLVFTVNQGGRRVAPSVRNEWGLYQNVNDTHPRRMKGYDPHFNVVVGIDSTAPVALSGKTTPVSASTLQSNATKTKVTKVST